MLSEFTILTYSLFPYDDLLDFPYWSEVFYHCYTSSILYSSTSIHLLCTTFRLCTKGPMPETYSDFWRMIWEQRVFIIVMMTRLEERSRVKCDQYWPTRGPESYASGLLTVTPVDTIELAYYTIRTFNLTARGIDDECREVRHFQFTSWPDHGVPEYPIPLLLFIRRVRATLASSSTNATSGPGATLNQTNLIEQGPVVVHCSAGVGRTGKQLRSFNWLSEAALVQ